MDADRNQQEVLYVLAQPLNDRIALCTMIRIDTLLAIQASAKKADEPFKVVHDLHDPFRTWRKMLRAMKLMLWSITKPGAGKEIHGYEPTPAGYRPRV